MRLKMLSWIAAWIASLCLMGCNTVHGMGQDIQQAGNAISNASKK